MAFLDPGPPTFAARCVKHSGHEGQCAFELHAEPRMYGPIAPTLEVVTALRLDLEEEADCLKSQLRDVELDLAAVTAEMERLSGS